MTIFAEQLKKFRQEKNISQEELAKQLFISRQAISKWENGDATPDLGNLVKLAEIFDVSLDCLVLGKDDNENPVDKSEFLYNPNTGMYERQYPKITNFYEFAARFWPFLLILLYFIYSLINLLLNHFK